ncbi:putative acetyltransferase [Staphylococcus auricularis]|uniref:GNAT family N-acetyltransferase n=1 Tax=Staphylococcus auricularis TaxID=29379 RepID=A0AAP8TT17_9STAP|nr:GNAT family N-acetyltransferase [Staphylococcus auricularis]MBM0867507.1 GNAT family N-acetyltransferase [Staphylococcus auricularis]MCG7341607.1 GNAT family N-acetyltransferase [Staphylococcus auricularis]PNZ67322.1 GNAT family N-acetyltransferase [Staphylococcus auricularis]QPT06419.1 GNAT family N-acetyltransferase [Staphylococcus auricularis]SQJ16434.1 acetyltransferase [Staphylococcus auricularis]
MVEFRELTMADESLYCDYVKEWIDKNEVIAPEITNITNYQSFEDLVHQLADNKSHDETVDNTTLFLIDDKQIIGAANIRHELTNSLKTEGGHVEIGVRNRLRGKGYKQKILKKALDYLSRIDVKEALLTCDADNEDTIEMIKKNGGEEIEDAKTEEGKVVKRFLIEIA